MPQLSFIAQPVDGRRADSQLLGALTDWEEPCPFAW